MTIQSLPLRMLIKRFAGFLPLLIFACFFYILIFSVVLTLIFKNFTDEPMVFRVILGVSSVLVIAFIMLYLRFLFKGLSSCYLKVKDGLLEVRLQQALSQPTVQISLDNIEKIQLGQSLDRLEKLFDKMNSFGIPRTSVAINKDLKAGRLLVKEFGEKTRVFHLIDKIYSEQNLIMFFEELDTKGVNLEVVSAN